MEYSETLRSEMVGKVAGPQAVSAHALSKRMGIGQPTLSRWLREAKLTGVSSGSKRAGATPGGRPLERWTAEEKLRAVTSAASLEGTVLGELLRREGLHEADLRSFREEALAGLAPTARARGRSPEAKQIAELQRELRRKEKALADAAALLASQKSRSPLGRRGRRHGREERAMILGLVDTAVTSGARRAEACARLDIDPRTLERWLARGRTARSARSAAQQALQGGARAPRRGGDERAVSRAVAEANRAAPGRRVRVRRLRVDDVPRAARPQVDDPSWQVEAAGGAATCRTRRLRAVPGLELGHHVPAHSGPRPVLLPCT